jgi:ABC-type multidrug transport system fused ATPase/permease subunit
MSYKGLIMKTDNVVEKSIASFLSDKPIWVWWLSYIVLTGVLFGIFYLALYLLTINWWVGVLILLIIGIVWGSIKHFQISGRIKKEKREAAQPV